MKIYALIAHVTEDSELMGIYDSKESAEKQKAICDQLGWDAMMVVYEMDMGRYYEDGIARQK